MDFSVGTPLFGVFVLVAFGLLVTVTGGVVYLTLADWRDRRRLERELREERRSQKSRQAR